MEALKTEAGTRSHVCRDYRDYEMARVYPRDVAELLRPAATVWPAGPARWLRIDFITDELARRGLCRARDDASEPWRRVEAAA